MRRTRRFARWGHPVETQVRDHAGMSFALAAMRPFNTFSTFSIWRSEADMLSMVRGLDPANDGDEHQRAMRERERRDFHYEFTTLRFVPVKEVGTWRGRSSLVTSVSGPLTENA